MITDGGTPVGERDARTVYEFCAWMAAVVAHHWGGKTSDHLPACSQYLDMAIGPLSGNAPLSGDYDWTAAGALTMATEMIRG